MEKTFGRDFGRVRIHDSLEAQRSAREVGAAAYTFGNNIALGKGVSDLRPASFPILAHELTHVLQQGGTHASPSSLDGALDVEQEREATQIGRTWSPIAAAPELLAGRPAVMRVPEAEAPAAAVAPRAEKTPALGAGTQQWYHEHWDFPLEPGLPVGPLNFEGFAFDGEVNVQFGAFGTSPQEAAGPSKTQTKPEGVEEEGEAPWQFRAGKTLTRGHEHGEKSWAFGVQAELEYTAREKIRVLGAEYRPVYKGMANVTTEGAEVSLEGKLENKLLTPGLTFKLLEVKWDEEKKVRFMNLSFFVETGHKFDHHFANGLDGTIEIKGTFEFEFQPNWTWPGWRTIATEIAQAVRTGASFIRGLLVVEETGTATTTAAVGTAALVGAAYVAWVVYGLYQIGKAHERGRREAVLNDFAAGYADVLSLLIGDLKSVRASEATPLIDVDWKADLTKAIGVYQHGESLFIPATANRAGRAAVVQDVIAIVENEGVEGWNARAARLRKQYGDTSWERRRTIGDRLLAQVARGDETIGIRLE